MMNIHLAVAAAGMLLLVTTPLGRADSTDRVTVNSPTDVEQSPRDLSFPLTIDHTGSPSASPEINVIVDANSELSESPASSGVGGLLVLIAGFVTLAAIAFVATGVIDRLLKSPRHLRRRSAHLD